jgi:hypothetical protein
VGQFDDWRFRTSTATLLTEVSEVAQKIRREFTVERHGVDNLVVYEIFQEDLEQLEHEALTVSEDLTFGVFAVAVAISFSIALATTAIDSLKTFTVFWVVTLVAWIASAFFGIRWHRGRKHFKGVTSKIRARGGPLGQEGKELEPSELENLPAESTGVSR